MSVPEFVFETEFTLLDVGATGALVRSGGVRPTVMAYDGQGNVESAVLEWQDDVPPEDVFEEARRWLRDLRPVAYGFVGLLQREGDGMAMLRTTSSPPEGALLGLCLRASDGTVRGALYPVVHRPAGAVLGTPSVTGPDDTDWCPIGDIWGNPFCVGDIVQFRPPNRAVDPASPLWKTIVELTKLRVQTNRYRSQEYMDFLDDLRNSIFEVASRVPPDPLLVALKPRTTFNPVGYVLAHSTELVLLKGRGRQPQSKEPA